MSESTIEIPDPFTPGWRIAWRGPAVKPGILRNVRLPQEAQLVSAQITDLEIGHRTLTALSTGEHRFRYLLRILASFEWHGGRVLATPITWHHEFTSADAAADFCRREFGWAFSNPNGLDVPINNHDAAASNYGAKRNDKEEGQLTSAGVHDQREVTVTLSVSDEWLLVGGDSATKADVQNLRDSASAPLCWIAPRPMPPNYWPPFDASVSLDPSELARHERMAKRSTPLLTSIKLTLVVTVFILLWLKFG